MLQFFRKHQKYFYIFTTTIIIISFSFFGTGSAIPEDNYVDETAFVAVDGTPISRSQLERMASFLRSDVEDIHQSGMWGANFFNDGVIQKDFIETGMAKLLIQNYSDLLKSDLEPKVAREQRYETYKHPGNKSISAEEIWNRTTPDKIKYLKVLQSNQDPLSPEAVDARLNLYLQERVFSGQDLKHALMYVEQMNSQYLRPDRNLPYNDLSLFGYHTIEDWMGPSFVRLVSEFIINSAIIAEQQGYDVPKEEVLADLINNAQVSFKQNNDNMRLGVASVDQYYQEQLRRLHMDQNQAVKIWRQVMLFRRMFQDVGNAIITDAFTFKKFNEFAKDTVSGELYQLPAELQLGSFRDLQQFETYLKAISGKREDISVLPQNFLAVEKVPQELVQYRYVVELAEVNKNQLQSRVGVKEMWDWQVEDTNWKLLVNEYPDLGQAEPLTADYRREVLDRLDEITRSRVDNFSRKQIAAEHPEWIAEVLERSPKQRKELAIRKKGGANPLPGLSNREEFLTFLNSENAEQARIYTPDQTNYYLITVVEKDTQPKVMTFAQAKGEGVLNELVNEELQNHYERIRDLNAKEYQLPDGKWKELHHVKDQVAESYYSKTLKAIAEKTGIKTPDAAATQRLLPYVQNVQKEIKKDHAKRELYIKSESNEGDPLVEQWKLIVAPFSADRSTASAQLLQAKAESWTVPEAAPNGAITFRFVGERGVADSSKALVREVERAHRTLSNESQRLYMEKVLKQLQEKDAISLNYLVPAE